MTATDLEEAMPTLLAPFPPGAEQYRAGPTWEKDGERWTRPLAYIDARAVFDRLDAAVGPGNWNTELERLGAGCYLCRLTVFNTVRCDVGQAGANEGEQEKSGASDALKRAAVQYGVGRYLYDRELPPVRLERRGNEWALPRGWRPPQNPSERYPEEKCGGEAGPPPAAAGGGSGVPATPKQIAKIGAEMARAGWGEERGREYVRTTFGKQSRRDLTAAEASRFIDALLAQPARAAERVS